MALSNVSGCLAMTAELSEANAGSGLQVFDDFTASGCPLHGPSEVVPVQPSRKRGMDGASAASLTDITNQARHEQDNPPQKMTILDSKLGPVKGDRLPGVAVEGTEGSVFTVCGTSVELREFNRDEVAADDPQRVSEYLADIYEKLGRDEEACEAGRLTDDIPQDWDPDMRAAVVDFLVGVQVQFGLKTETLFLAVSLLDRFLKAKPVKRGDLQLVGVAAMFVATKFEEIDPPDVRDFVHVTSSACAKDEIFEMEVVMLNTLGFGICCPTAPHFVERYQYADRCSEVHRHLMQYLLELSLLDVRMTKYTPSHQATAAALVSSSMLQLRPVWQADVARQAEAAELAVRRCARDMCVILQSAAASPHQSVREKFMKEEHHRVADLTL